jgi:sodium/hydrogen antiporter
VVALSHERDHAFSASLIYLALGLGAAVVVEIGGIDWLSPTEDGDLIQRVTELAVVIALFSTGLKLDRRLGFARWSSASRLLLLTMPLTIAAVALAGVTLLGLSLPAAIILGAALAPTDPVLAGEIGV